QISFTATGHVQAVFFRSFTREKAQNLFLTGFVKNLPDGRTVVGEAQGSPENLDKLVQHLRLGPRGARVDELKYEEVVAKDGEEGGFEV
ncbi:uncharacterized protein MYCFIDRAFT_38617, partial [Pseudocercospora fijiensis CIRAD86]